MIEWLNENPIIAFAGLVVVIFVLMFSFVKVKKKKPQKAEPKKDSVDKKTGEETSAETGETSPDETSAEEPPIKIRAKHAKTRPQIEQIYKRVYEKTEQKKEEVETDEFEGKQAQFVKSSGKVSKFIGFEEVAKKEEELAVAQMLQEQAQAEENCEICEPKAHHFDRTRRLSKMIREDAFDDMLEAHISGHYLNIDEKKHLRLSDDFSEKLFDRAMKTLSNSDVKVLVDDSESEEKPFEKMRGDKAYMKEWLADRRRENMANFIAVTDQSSNESGLDDEDIEKLENEIDLSSKNIIVVDSIVNRKGKRKNK